MKERDTSALLFKISLGDEVAFNALFTLYGHQVNSFALRLTRSESLAEETVQEVFLKVWLKRATLKSVDNFSSYLFTIVRNHVYNHLRRKALEESAKIFLRNEMTLSYQPDSDEILEQRKQILRQIVDGMPRRQRIVYDLCHRDGLKYEEAATKLNISRLTVKTHMQQAIRTIRLHFSRSLIPALASLFVTL